MHAYSASDFASEIPALEGEAGDLTFTLPPATYGLYKQWVAAFPKDAPTIEQAETTAALAIGSFSAEIDENDPPLHLGQFAAIATDRHLGRHLVLENSARFLERLDRKKPTVKFVFNSADYCDLIPALVDHPATIHLPNRLLSNTYGQWRKKTTEVEGGRTERLAEATAAICDLPLTDETPLCHMSFLAEAAIDYFGTRLAKKNWRMTLLLLTRQIGQQS